MAELHTTALQMWRWHLKMVQSFSTIRQHGFCWQKSQLWNPGTAPAAIYALETLRSCKWEELTSHRGKLDIPHKSCTPQGWASSFIVKHNLSQDYSGMNVQLIRMELTSRTLNMSTSNSDSATTPWSIRDNRDI